MSTKYVSKLACELISEQFGEDAESIICLLTSRGEQSFADIVRTTRVPSAKLRSCLLVLIQHNCVQAFRHDASDASIPQGPATSYSAAVSHVRYIALLPNILHRLRFPKLMQHIKPMGAQAEAVLEGLLEHGRLSVQQVCQRAMAQADSGNESSVRSTTLSAMAGLIRQRYLERCPAPEPTVPPRRVSDVAKKALRGGMRSRATVVAEGYFQAEENRILALAQAADGERFRLPIELMLAEEPEKGKDVKQLPDTVRSDEALPAVTLGLKRKRDEEDNEHPDGVGSSSSGGVLGSADMEHVLWRVNYEEFMKQLRHTVCERVVRDRFDVASAVVVSAVLNASSAEETSACHPFTASLSVEAVSDLVRSTPEGSAMTSERVRMILQQLAADPAELVKRAADFGPAHYSIQMKRIVDLAQMREVEAVITQRFGRAACRVFRLLLQKRQLEEKQIGELAMIPLKDCRECLYKLLKDGFVNLQELAKTADHAPSRTFYLWTVHLAGVFRNVLDHMCKAAYNLRKRLKHELEQEHELMSLLDTRAGNPRGAEGTSLQLTSVQRQQLERIRKVAAVLESSLLRLDDSILLFTCF